MQISLKHEVRGRLTANLSNKIFVRISVLPQVETHRRSSIEGHSRAYNTLPEFHNGQLKLGPPVNNSQRTAGVSLKSTSLSWVALRRKLRTLQRAESSTCRCLDDGDWLVVRRLRLRVGALAVGLRNGAAGRRHQRQHARALGGANGWKMRRQEADVLQFDRTYEHT